MSNLVLPAIFVTLLWFFSTGAILWLNRLPRETHPGSITAATPLAGAAVCGLIVAAGEANAAGYYLAFTSALVIWGWHEMSFLMGFVGGPTHLPCPADARGWRRFRLAAGTVIHHELALAATLGAIILLSWDQPYQIGAMTFALLFALRLSAKLNIFLGVPSLSAELMPDHLAHLKSYFRTRRFNALFPLSMAAMLALAWWLAGAAMAQAHAGYALLLALTLLGIAEHVLMMIPVRDAAMWRWAQPPAWIVTNDKGRPQ